VVEGGKPAVDSRNGGEAYWKEQSVIRREEKWWTSAIVTQIA